MNSPKQTQKKGNKQNKLVKRLAILGVAAGLIAFFVYAFLPKPVPVDLTQVTRGAMEVTVGDEGYTRVHDVYVVSAPVSGHLLRIDQHVGDEVVAGETLLARLLPSDPGFLDARSKSQAEAAVRSAEARVEFALADARRARQMYKQDSISRADLDRAELALKTARAELENARAVLITPGKGGSTDEQGVVRIVSPVTGRVLQLRQESENVVSAGTPLMELGDPANIEIVVDLLSRDAVKVQDNAAVKITGWGGDGALNGRVRRVEPYGFTKISALGIEEQRVNVIIDLTDPREKWLSLGHGYRVDAAITIWQGEDVLQVPTGALFRHAGEWAVFKVVDSKAVMTPVRTGQNNGRVAQILEGLDEGDTVVLHPSERIGEGVELEEREV